MYPQILLSRQKHKPRHRHRGGVYHLTSRWSHVLPTQRGKWYAGGGPGDNSSQKPTRDDHGDMHMRPADYRRRQVLYGMRPAPAVVAAQPAACPRCGRKATDPASFCSGCGAAMTGFPVLREPTAAPPQGFQWKWALLTIPIVVAVTVACMVVAVIVAGVTGYSLEDADSQQFVGLIVLLISLLLGGITAGWLSPGRTILEPGVGIAAALIGFNVLMGDTSSLLLGWILPFGIGAGGARIGEWLQGRFARSRR